MAQVVLRVGGLPAAPLDAAEAFYQAWMPQARAALVPPPSGEGDHAKHGGGAREGEVPLHHPAGGPPPRDGEELVIVFPTATYDHRNWRLAAMQDLAREAAPHRVNGIVGDDDEAIADTLHWLASAPGVTGQLLAVDGKSNENG